MRQRYQRLAEEYGTPLYVYDLDQVDAAFEELRHSLPQPAVIHYSLKANPHPELAGRLRQAGAYAEISSTGELRAAGAAGYPGPACFYTGPAKTEREIDAALAAGVTRFSVESATDLRRVAARASRAGMTAECLVRVNPAAVSPAGLRMARPGGQFGVDAAELAAHPEAFRSRPGAQVVGVHFFPFSSARDEQSLTDQLLSHVRLTRQLRAGGCEPTVVNLGGGFAAPYARPAARPRYHQLAGRLAAALDEHLPGWRTGDPVVGYESGRYLVGSCGTLVTRIVDVKVNGGATVALLDSGINHLGGMSALGRVVRMSAVPLGWDGVPPGPPVALAGPLCTPLDTWGSARPARAPRPGELVAVPHVGAYGLTASLVAFLSRPAPVEVVVRGDRVLSASTVELNRVRVDR
jgi:diaminopimelate decarboxylase